VRCPISDGVDADDADAKMKGRDHIKGAAVRVMDGPCMFQRLRYDRVCVCVRPGQPFQNRASRSRMPVRMLVRITLPSKRQ